MIRSSNPDKRRITKESVEQYCQWLYECEKVMEPLSNTGIILYCLCNI